MKNKHVVVRRGAEEMQQEILVGNIRPDESLAAAALDLERVRREALDITARRNRDDRLFLRDQIFVAHRLKSTYDNLGLSLVTVFFPKLGDFFFYDA